MNARTTAEPADNIAAFVSNDFREWCLMGGGTIAIRTAQPHPGLGDIEVVGDLARCQKIFGSASALDFIGETAGAAVKVMPALLRFRSGHSTHSSLCARPNSHKKTGADLGAMLIALVISCGLRVSASNPYCATLFLNERSF
jgi:hypothetical protein